MEVKAVTEMKVRMVPVVRSEAVPERFILWWESGGRQGMAVEITRRLEKKPGRSKAQEERRSQCYNM